MRLENTQASTEMDYLSVKSTADINIKQNKGDYASTCSRSEGEG